MKILKTVEAVREREREREHNSNELSFICVGKNIVVIVNLYKYKTERIE